MFPQPSPGLHKSKWSIEEDEKLVNAVATDGIGSWSKIALRVPGRSGKQCRERWLGQLAPSVDKSNWTPEEDWRLLRGHAIHGNRWSVIAAFFPGRTPITIKNRWNWMLRHRPPEAPPMPSYAIENPATLPHDPPLPRTEVFEPLNADAGLFGVPFRTFQAEMFR
jgi:hypothetical protein